MMRVWIWNNSVTFPVNLQKKKDKKRSKDKRRSYSPSPPPQTTGRPHGSSGSVTPKDGDDLAFSESELESQRAALLAQLNESADE